MALHDTTDVLGGILLCSSHIWGLGLWVRMVVGVFFERVVAVPCLRWIYHYRSLSCAVTRG